MGNFLSSFITTATIDPNKKDLNAGTVSSVVITGIVVVFIALILLIVCVSIYGAIFNAAAKKKAAKAEAEKKAAELAKAKTVLPVPKVEAVPAIEDGIEEETVAVIMAAIAAMSASAGKKLVLKSVKTSRPQRSAWSSAGIAENTRPF
ncbi:MAG: OadG family protein [Ruminococcus sp.]|nr:OadG family protein [Ruminococcus sp.]